jgi:hypothetical protein
VERLDHAMALQVEESKQVQGIEVFRPLSQNSGAQPFGLVEIALPKPMISLPLQARQVRRRPRTFSPFCRQRAISFRETGDLESRQAATNQRRA